MAWLDWRLSGPKPYPGESSEESNGREGTAGDRISRGKCWFCEFVSGLRPDRQRERRQMEERKKKKVGPEIESLGGEQEQQAVCVRRSRQ